MKLVSRYHFLSFFLIFAIAFCGCANVGVLMSPISTGVVFWINGVAHKYYENEPGIVYKAVKRTLNELEQEITSDKSHGKGYKIIAGKKNSIILTISKTDDNICELNIRVNYIGDKEFAELIYKRVDKQLDIIQFNKDGKPTKKSIKSALDACSK